MGTSPEQTLSRFLGEEIAPLGFRITGPLPVLRGHPDRIGMEAQDRQQQPGGRQGLRIFNLACGKYFGQVVIIPATAQSLGLEAIVGRLLLLQQADRQSPQ